MANWYQVNFDGFGDKFSSGVTSSTRLFVFNDNLYAYNDAGMFRLDDAKCRVWKKVYTPTSPPWSLTLLGNYLYLYQSENAPLHWIKSGTSFNSSNWQQASSTGLQGGSNPVPMALFDNHIYGIHRYYDTTGAWFFEVWRSKDVGKSVIGWERVVENSFGDPTNNQGVDMIAEYNNHLYIGTNTRRLVFGAYTGYGTGVEIWESASGAIGSWKQVNEDGFSTEIPHPDDNRKKLRTNQDIGSWVVYKPPAATQPYFYIGTRAHYGAEIWQYDGKGQSGWKNVTPSWAGPGFGPQIVKRFEAMAVFKKNPIVQTSLYAAEGFDTGALSQYDGQQWSSVVAASTFNPQNLGLASLAVVKDILYLSTRKSISVGASSGDQVWGYPFPYKQKIACIELSWLNQRVTIESSGLWKLVATIKNTGEQPIEEAYLIAAYLDGNFAYSEPGPLLAPGGEAEITFSLKASGEDHELTIVADDLNQLGRADKQSNRFSLSLTESRQGEADNTLSLTLLLLGLILFFPSIMRRLASRSRK